MCFMIFWGVGDEREKKETRDSFKIIIEISMQYRVKFKIKKFYKYIKYMVKI